MIRMVGFDDKDNVQLESIDKVSFYDLKFELKLLKNEMRMLMMGMSMNTHYDDDKEIFY
jgi:hypothetical protein